MSADWPVNRPLDDLKATSTTIATTSMTCRQPARTEVTLSTTQEMQDLQVIWMQHVAHQRHTVIHIPASLKVTRYESRRGIPAAIWLEVVESHFSATTIALGTDYP